MVKKMLIKYCSIEITNDQTAKPYNFNRKT